MQMEQRRIDELIARPAEGLNFEIKRWLNPDQPEDAAKIVKAAIAIRNRNGGFVLIGFDDKTLQPDTHNVPPNVRAAFHLDKIQGLISKHASEPFEVAVAYGKRGSQEYPVIVIPEGIRVPVAAKRDLLDAQNRKLVREGDVYFRTLAANGTPSTAVARPGDWREIVEICFENREADIGRFLRRHLGQGDLQRFVAMLAGVQAAPPPTLRTRAENLLADGERRFQESVKARKLTPDQLEKIKVGSWSVAVVVDPPHSDALPDANFLNTVASSNPQYTGWPTWLDSRGFVDETTHPRVIDKAWQALIVSFDGWSKHVDFTRLDPKGEFYLRRILQDDLTDKVQPGEFLDVVLMMVRVAESMAVALAVARALGWPPETTKLGFGFRWTKLSGRELSSWANPMIHITSGHVAHDDIASSFVEVPLDTPPSALAPYLEQAIRELFIVFDGYTLPTTVIEDWVQRLIERRL
jgi:hypothetical protein